MLSWNKGMRQLLFDFNYLPPAKIHLVLQAALYHILVSSNREASLCNRSLLLAQVLLEVIWQILSGVCLCCHPEQTSDMHFIKSILFSLKSISTELYIVPAIFGSNDKVERLALVPPLRHQNSHIRKYQEARRQIKLERESTKAEDNLYQTHSLFPQSGKQLTHNIKQIWLRNVA